MNYPYLSGKVQIGDVKNKEGKKGNHSSDVYFNSDEERKCQWPIFLCIMQ